MRNWMTAIAFVGAMSLTASAEQIPSAPSIPSLPKESRADGSKEPESSSVREDEAWQPSILVVLSSSFDASPVMQTQTIDRVIYRPVSEAVHKDGKPVRVTRFVAEKRRVEVAVPTHGATHIRCNDFDLQVTTDEAGKRQYAFEIAEHLELKQGTTTITADGATLNDGRLILNDVRIQTPESTMTTEQLTLELTVQSVRLLDATVPPQTAPVPADSPSPSFESPTPSYHPDDGVFEPQEPASASPFAPASS